MPQWIRNLPFISLHVACIAVLFTGVTWTSVLLCGFNYFIRMFGITAGYHRYFAHRSYRTSRAFQFLMACLGCSAMQKGPLWWAAHHRHHHKYSDTDGDPHSPIVKSIWHSHVGWVLSPDHDDTEWDAIRDFTRYQELRYLNLLHWVPGILLGVMCWWIDGWAGLAVGFFVSTVLLYHGVFCVNSLCHLWGGRRYATTDASRNNWLVALFTLGEGWHNNHHYYQSSANQGFWWWEIDISYYIITMLSWFGIVWDVRKPPAKRLNSNRVAPLAKRRQRKQRVK